MTLFPLYILSSYIGAPSFTLHSRICLFFFPGRFTEEYFNAVDGDLILILYSFPVVFIYMVLSMGKFNLVEHGVFNILLQIGHVHTLPCRQTIYGYMYL